MSRLKRIRDSIRDDIFLSPDCTFQLRYIYFLHETTFLLFLRDNVYVDLKVDVIILDFRIKKPERIQKPNINKNDVILVWYYINYLSLNNLRTITLNIKVLCSISSLIFYSESRLPRLLNVWVYI